MKKLLLIAALAATTANSASSISGSTNFQVNIPEILVLYHWDEAKLDLTGKNFAYPDTNSHTNTATVTLDDTTATITENPVDTATNVPSFMTSGNTMTVTLENSWAVRSIATSNVTLGVEIKNANHYLDGDSGSGSNAIVKDATLSETSIAPQWTPTTGDIVFKLDLTGITKPGWHKTTATRVKWDNAAASPSTTDTFLLTLTGN